MPPSLRDSPGAADAPSQEGFPDEIFDQAIDAVDTIIKELGQEFPWAAAGRLSLPNRDIKAVKDQATIEYTHALLALQELKIIFDEELRKKPGDRRHPSDLIAFYQQRNQSLLDTLPPFFRKRGEKGRARALSRFIDFYALNNGTAPHELGVVSNVRSRILGIPILNRGLRLTIAPLKEEQRALNAVTCDGKVLESQIGTRLELLRWFDRFYGFTYGPKEGDDAWHLIQ